MDKVLRPDRLELDLATSTQGGNANKFTHWSTTMDNFLETLKGTVTSDEAKYKVLINFISPDIFLHISGLTKYTEASALLQALFVKTKNPNYARHCLAMRTQKEGESIELYLLALEKLAKECDFKDVTAAAHQEECIRTAFISGLSSHQIRQRLLEDTKPLSDTTKAASTLEQALRESKHYNHRASDEGHLAATDSCSVGQESISHVAAVQGRAQFQSQKGGDKHCDYCGYSPHNRKVCPARDAPCHNCDRRGHFSSVCRQRKRNPDKRSAAMRRPANDDHVPAEMDAYTPFLAATSSTPYPSSLSHSVVNVKVNDHFNGYLLIDTGSSESFISKSFASKLGVKLSNCNNSITLASENHVSRTVGACHVNINLNEHSLRNVRLMVLEQLCCDIILGLDILKEHERLVLSFSGHKAPIELTSPFSPSISCSLAKADIEPPSLFANLEGNLRPIACGSRKFSDQESCFIKQTIDSLLESDIIRPSNSPWRAQVLVTGLNKPNAKPRMVVDYSRTINKFTLLDAYPLPNMERVVSSIAKYSIYSTFDLKSAYYQIPIMENEKSYTAFEAAGRLFEFNVIPFGVKNGVAAFQRVIDQIIDQEKLEGTFAYLDNITVAGESQEEHDENVKKFLDIVEKYSLTLNKEKTAGPTTSINILGYLVSKGQMRPDPDRMEPLLKLPLPKDPASLQRALGLFSYYSRWVEKYSDMVQPLIKEPSFPLSETCNTAFESIKSKIASSCIVCPNDRDNLVLESDASEFALSASLNQGGKPVAFFSRTLKAHERRHHAVEKEACAIVEACRKWQHYLAGRKFTLITDQQAISFMFSHQTHGKIKNNKIQRWRIELSTLDFDIKYRPGPENVTADCLSRAYCSALAYGYPDLVDIHENLCHPGVARLYHFVRVRNMPFSIDQVKKVTADCGDCARIKPKFIRPLNPPLIEATKPLDRISIDFKGPLPSSTRNKYMLVIIDEYSRFPFVYACPNMESSTIIRCLSNLFSMFGTVGYVHSDNGPSLISSELRKFFLDHGIGFSNSSKYNPRGNSQVERYNGVIWKAIQLALSSKKLPLTHWEIVLPEVLHAQRTLLCTATNQTPHERLFSFQRRSASGKPVPSWLLTQKKVLAKRHVRRSKYDPLCDEVDLVSVNPANARVRYPGGREDTVSLRDLAPLPVSESNAENSTGSAVKEIPPVPPSVTVAPSTPAPSNPPTSSCIPEPCHLSELPEPPPRRSTRESRPPDRFQAG